MKIRLEVTPDFHRVTAQKYEEGERAVQAAIRESGSRLKQSWRDQIERAGLGTRLARSIRNATYPKTGSSMDAAALVWSKAAKIISAHEKGALIRSKHGFYMAIPTDAAGKGRGGARLTPAEWERRRGLKLRFVYRRGRPSMLVADKARINTRNIAVASRAKTGRGQVTAPIFILVPQVRLRKRLDLARDAKRVADDLPALIIRKWGEE